MISASRGRGTIFSTTLTELVFLMFFVLLLFVGKLQGDLREVQKGIGKIRKAAGLDVDADPAVITKAEVQRFRDLSRLYQDMREVAPNDTDEFNHMVSGALKEHERMRQKMEELQSELSEEENLAKARLKETAECVENVKALRDQFEVQRRKGGFDFPPCWVDPITKKIQYLFEITVRDTSVSVRRRWTAERDEDAKEIPGVLELIGDDLSLDEFARRAVPILEWSKAQDPECRHYVYMQDRANEKVPFKKSLLRIEDFFYKYLSR